MSSVSTHLLSHAPPADACAWGQGPQGQRAQRPGRAHATRPVRTLSWAEGGEEGGATPLERRGVRDSLKHGCPEVGGTGTPTGTAGAGSLPGDLTAQLSKPRSLLWHLRTQPGPRSGREAGGSCPSVSQGLSLLAPPRGPPRALCGVGTCGVWAGGLRGWGRRLVASLLLPART